MGIKAVISYPYAKLVLRKVNEWKSNPLEAQERVFKMLLSHLAQTKFGKDHGIENVKSYEEFKKALPVRDYEELKPYIDAIISGEKNVLWTGKPLYFCKTSGTTSGTKYIPISNESIHNHIDTAKIALLSYISETKKTKFVDGKMIFLQGSPELSKKGDINTGRLSGIVAHHVPAYLQKNRMPSYETNSIDDWETKVDKIVEETLKVDMRLISGIPSWVQMYFEKLIEKTGKSDVKSIFPNFDLFVYGGVNFDPYRAKFEKLIGKKIDSVETYPASEGFIAFQDSQHTEGLLLNVDSGIFFEFIPASEFFNENPTRISLKDVELGVNYALILNTNAGLWGYSIGDTLKFISKNPYRILVTGRIKHFTSAFGEHVIAEEIDFAMQHAAQKFGAEIAEFHVAPEVAPKNGLPYHEWLIEFHKKPSDRIAFALELDKLMQEKNIYYKDLIAGNILRPIIITPIQKGGFIQYMKSKGKLGGQNKIPKLMNDRSLANELLQWKE